MLRNHISQQQDTCEEGPEVVIQSDTQVTFVKQASKFGIIALLVLWLYNSSITWCKKAKHRTIVDDVNIWGLHNYNNPKGANEK